MLAAPGILTLAFGVVVPGACSKIAIPAEAPVAPARYDRLFKVSLREI